METIRAIVTSRDQPSGLAIRSVPAPQLASSEALVHVAAVGLNLGEVRGAPQQPAGKRLGWDFAGTVETPAADGSGPAKGARVCGIVESGAWAEIIAAPTRQLAPLPAEVSFAEAATLPLAGLTGWFAVAKAGPLLQRRVLVTGASHGGGFFAAQLARLAGAEVLDSLEDESTTLDAIVDSRGGADLAHLMSRLAPGGTVVSYLVSSAPSLDFDLRSFVVGGGRRLLGLEVFYELRHTPASDALGRLAELLAGGQLRTVVGEAASWGELQQVSARLLSKERRPGTTVLLLD